MSVWPTPDEEARLLTKLKSRSPHATADFAVAYYHLLYETLQRKFPKVDPDWIYDAVAETYEMITTDPSKYRPEAGAFGPFLLFAARRDLLNRLKKENRHASRRNPEMDVEHLGEAGKVVGGELELREAAERIEVEILPAILIGLTPEEQAGFDLIVDGERATSVFVAALGFQHLPPEDHEPAVKRFKDKIKLRIKRARGRHDETS